MSPKGPRGNYKHQSVRVSMASIYSSHWNGRTGNTKGVIAGAPRHFGISRGHPLIIVIIVIVIVINIVVIIIIIIIINIIIIIIIIIISSIIIIIIIIIV